MTRLDDAVSPGLGRRLAAIFYDSWLVVALWLIGATVDTFVQAGMGSGEAPVRLPLQLYVVLTPFVFFGWFWTHGGQTLGMRAWRMRLLDADGNDVTWRASFVRVAAAGLSVSALGLGYLWMWLDRDRLTWHDRLSGTRLVLLQKD